MSQDRRAVLEGRRAVPPDQAEPIPRRINVAVSREMLAAIDRVIDREQVTLTEAVRRLIAYGDLVFRMTRLENASLVIRDGNGGEREVVVL